MASSLPQQVRERAVGRCEYCQLPEDRPLGEVTVAYDLLLAKQIDEVGVIVNPGSDLGLDRLGQELAGALEEDLGEGSCPP